MKVMLIYVPKTPEDRRIEYFIHRLEQQSIPVELINADTKEGIAICELYDILDRPAVVLANHDGSSVNRWIHGLPSPEEVASYYQRN